MMHEDFHKFHKLSKKKFCSSDRTMMWILKRMMNSNICWNRRSHVTVMILGLVLFSSGHLVAERIGHVLQRPRGQRARAPHFAATGPGPFGQFHFPHRAASSRHQSGHRTSADVGFRRRGHQVDLRQGTITIYVISASRICVNQVERAVIFCLARANVWQNNRKISWVTH